MAPNEVSAIMYNDIEQSYVFNDLSEGKCTYHIVRKAILCYPSGGASVHRKTLLLQFFVNEKNIRV